MIQKHRCNPNTATDSVSPAVIRVHQSRSKEVCGISLETIKESLEFQRCSMSTAGHNRSQQFCASNSNGSRCEALQETWMESDYRMRRCEDLILFLASGAAVSDLIGHHQSFIQSGRRRRRSFSELSLPLDFRKFLRHQDKRKIMGIDGEKHAGVNRVSRLRSSALQMLLYFASLCFKSVFNTRCFSAQEAGMALFIYNIDALFTTSADVFHLGMRC